MECGTNVTNKDAWGDEKKEKIKKRPVLVLCAIFIDLSYT
jgi:hypothetical protein